MSTRPYPHPVTALKVVAIAVLSGISSGPALAQTTPADSGGASPATQPKVRRPSARKTRGGNDTVAAPSKWALLIGIDDYENENLTDLQFAVKDVQTVADELRKSAGFAPEKVKVMTTDLDKASTLYPSADNVITQLQLLADNVEPNDLFVFYFSGHSFQSAKNQLLATANANPFNLTTLRKTTLSLDDLNEQLNAIRARQSVLVFDACRNDPLKGRGADSNALSGEFVEDIKKLAVQSTLNEERTVGRALLMACSQGQKAWEWPEQQHGAFTYFLLEGLRGKATAATGEITAYSLFTYVQTKVAEWSKLNKPQAQRPDFTLQGAPIVLTDSPAPVANVPNDDALRVHVESDPPGALVLIDGKDSGQVTPCTVPLDFFMRTARVEVALELAGYETKRQKVLLQRGHTAALSTKLIRLNTVNAETTPAPDPQIVPPASIETPKIETPKIVAPLDNPNPIPLNNAPTPLPPSNPIPTPALIPAPAPAPVNLVPAPVNGGKVEELDTTAHLKITSTPPGAKVYIDGIEQQMQTPCDITQDLGIAKTKRLEVGLIVNGFKPFVRLVTLERGLATPLEASLQLLPPVAPRVVVTQVAPTVQPNPQFNVPAPALIAPVAPAVPIGTGIDYGTLYLARTLTGHTNGVGAAVYSPNNKLVASGGGDKTVRLWDATTGETLFTLSPHWAAVTALCFAPDSAVLCSGSWDNMLRLWDTATGKLNQTLKGHAAAVSAVTYSPDGKVLVSASEDGNVLVWDVASGQSHPLAAVDGKAHAGRVRAVAIAPDGKTIATAGDDKVVRLWDIESGAVKQTITHLSSVTAVAFSPLGASLASASGTTVTLWNLEGRRIGAMDGHNDVVWAIAFAPDGRTLASGGDDGTVILWNTDTRTLKRQLNDHKGKIKSLNFSLDGRSMASAANDGTVKLWRNTATNTTPKTSP